MILLRNKWLINTLFSICLVFGGLHKPRGSISTKLTLAKLQAIRSVGSGEKNDTLKFICMPYHYSNFVCSGIYQVL